MSKSVSEAPVSALMRQSSISIFLLDGFTWISKWYPEFNMAQIYHLSPETDSFFGGIPNESLFCVALDQIFQVIFDSPLITHMQQFENFVSIISMMSYN